MKESNKPPSKVQHETMKEKEQLDSPCLPAPSAEEEPTRLPQRSSPNLLEPARPDTFNFRFAADGNFKAKFDRLAEVLGVENPLKNMAEVFERAVDISLDKKDPKRKRERRLEKERKRSASLEKSSPDEISALTEKTEKERSRFIPSEVRERVFERAGYQCEFTSADGTRCSSRTRLEIEHERPFAIYRSHEEQFLRVLCHQHNRFQAERIYGTEFIRNKIDEKKRQKIFRGCPPSASKEVVEVSSQPDARLEQVAGRWVSFPARSAST
jgi:hypothetical protein